MKKQNEWLKKILYGQVGTSKSCEYCGGWIPDESCEVFYFKQKFLLKTIKNLLKDAIDEAFDAGEEFGHLYFSADTSEMKKWLKRLYKRFNLSEEEE